LEIFSVVALRVGIRW